jgi:hypothetical protein
MMKGTPRKETSVIDVSAAMQQANELTALTTKQTRPEDESDRFVNLRIKETDYNRLKGLYGSAGLSMSAGAKMSMFYIADMIEEGAFKLSPGGIIDRRR